MSIKDTYKQLKDLLSNITSDIEKSENGNKAASQRVRTGTVKLEKLAKLFRKESISTEKKTKGQKKPSKTNNGVAKKGAAASKSKPGQSAQKAKPPTKAKAVSVKAKPKVTQARTSVRPRQLSAKRATAKLPTKRLGSR